MAAVANHDDNETDKKQKLMSPNDNIKAGKDMHIYKYVVLTRILQQSLRPSATFRYMARRTGEGHTFLRAVGASDLKGSGGAPSTAGGVV